MASITTGLVVLDISTPTNPTFVGSSDAFDARDVAVSGIYAYVTLNAGVEYSEELRGLLKKKVRSVIGPIATPDVIHWAPALPKTRSGKIMRRILGKIATNETDKIGDTSTLADPSVVENLIANR